MQEADKMITIDLDILSAGKLSGAARLGGAEWRDPVYLSHEVDAKFWTAESDYRHKREIWRSVIVEDQDDPDTAGDAVFEAMFAAELKMLMTGVRTLPALLAKMAHCRDEPHIRVDRLGDITRFDLLLWDVERMLGREYNA